MMYKWSLFREDGSEWCDYQSVLHASYQQQRNFKYWTTAFEVVSWYWWCCSVRQPQSILSLSLSLSLSLRYNSHFPGEPRLAGVYWSKGWWRWWHWQLDYTSYKSCNAPVKSSPPTNQHPVFYRPDALPVTQPTVSKHWRENITFHGLAYPKLTWESSNFVSGH